MDELNRMEPVVTLPDAEEPMQQYSNAVIKRAPLMAKWLWIIFWVMIASNVIGLLEFVPSLAKPVAVITTIISFVVCIIYFLFRGEDTRYQTGAILGFLNAIITGLNTLVLTPNGANGWVTFLNIIAAVIGLFMTYNLYYANHQIIGEANREVGEKWLKLWKWKIYVVVALIASLILVLILPILGALLAIAAAIFGAIVSIYELFVLYHSAQVYRDVLTEK